VPLPSRSVEQASAELAEDRCIEARVVQRQTEGVLPVYPAARGVRGAAIGEPFCELEHRDQCEPPRRLGRAPPPRGECGEVVVVEGGAELVAEGEVRLPAGNAARATRDVSSGTGPIC
jgi:hypothetical protein